MAKKNEKDKYEEIAGLKYEFFIRSEAGKKLKLLSRFKRGKEFKDFFYQSPIDIGFFRKDKGFANFGDRNRPWEVLRKIAGERIIPKEFIPFNAVDQKANTVIIKIHLDRNKTGTIKDIGILLRVLEKQAKQYSINIVRPRPHLDFYKDYLTVYDRRSEDPKEWTWPKIAKEIFPNEMIKNKRGKEIPDPNAVGKVRNYFRQAIKMINGGWKKI